MKKEENLSDKEKTARLAGKAFYKTKKTPKSQMIMIKDLQANRLDNLRKANKMAALAYFVEPDSKDLDINYDLVEVIFEVSNALIATKKTRNYDQGIPFFHCSIPFGFEVNMKNYERFILPWVRSPHHYHQFISSFDKYLIQETLVYCPYCKESILKLPQTSRTQAINMFKETYRKSLKEVRENLISDKETERMQHVFYSPSTYTPPWWSVSYFNCPKCKQKIMIEYSYFKGTNYKKHESDLIKPPKITIKEPVIKDEDYYPPFIESKRFDEVSHWLTPKGYNQLVNSFLGWAEPHVSNFEFEILKLVDSDTLEKYFEQEFSADKKPDKGEDQE